MPTRRKRNYCNVFVILALSHLLHPHVHTKQQVVQLQFLVALAHSDWNQEIKFTLYSAIFRDCFLATQLDSGGILRLHILH